MLRLESTTKHMLLAGMYLSGDFIECIEKYGSWKI